MGVSPSFPAPSHLQVKGTNTWVCLPRFQLPSHLQVKGTNTWVCLPRFQLPESFTSKRYKHMGVSPSFPDP